MLKNLRQIVRTPGSFAQNVAFMFTASAGGMAIQFLFMPLLSRIYDPEAYGQFGVFNAVLVVLGTAATLGYNQAFVLPKSETAF
ncbi:MAG: oligosaccharide flippase family protein [Flavobacteriales bacterium]